MNDFVSAHIAAWMGCLAFLVMLTYYGAGLVEKLRGKPPAGEVMRDIAALAEQVRELKTNERDAIQARRLIDDRIKEVEETARQELRDQVAELHACLDRLSADLLVFPDRVIAQLSNLGVLRRPHEGN